MWERVGQFGRVIGIIYICIRYFFQVPGCGAGYFEDQDSCACDLCPKGTYNDQETAESCTICPPGLDHP